MVTAAKAQGRKLPPSSSSRARARPAPSPSGLRRPSSGERGRTDLLLSPTETVNNSKVGLVFLPPPPSAPPLDRVKGGNSRTNRKKAMIEMPREGEGGKEGAKRESFVACATTECKYGGLEICRVYSAAAERLFMLGGRGNRAEWGREGGNEGKEDGRERERIPHPSLAHSSHFLSASLLQSIWSLPSPLSHFPLWLPFRRCDRQLAWWGRRRLILDEGHGWKCRSPCCRRLAVKTQRPRPSAAGTPERPNFISCRFPWFSRSPACLPAGLTQSHPTI